MSANAISKSQLKVAQVLWAQYEKKSLDVTAATKDESRKARLNFASDIAGRRVDSFKGLTRNEAHRLINALKKSLGLAITVKSRARAEDRGMQGRKSSPRHDVVVSAEDIARIQSALERLGWSQERFEKWLQSPSSPVKSAVIRTQGDANRVWWALKPMLKRAGQWKTDAA
jgi:hypothetical protein